LGVSLLAVRTTGSKVPCLSLIHARAASRPDAMPIDDRAASALLPEHTINPGFDIAVLSRPFISGSLAFAFADPI
jgi:hypothetical protein